MAWNDLSEEQRASAIEWLEHGATIGAAHPDVTNAAIDFLRGEKLDGDDANLRDWRQQQERERAASTRVDGPPDGLEHADRDELLRQLRTLREGTLRLAHETSRRMDEKQAIVELFGGVLAELFPDVRASGDGLLHAQRCVAQIRERASLRPLVLEHPTPKRPEILSLRLQQLLREIGEKPQAVLPGRLRGPWMGMANRLVKLGLATLDDAVLSITEKGRAVLRDGGA